jgi:hypothetical protein
MLYAASRSRKESEGCRSSLSTAGFTLMWNDARSRASFGPITLVNLSTVVLKSLACIFCNSTTIVMSNNPLSHSSECCALCASKLPPSIRARLTSERLLHAGHSSPRLLLMTSQSRQKTAFQRGELLRPDGSLFRRTYTPTSVAEMWAATFNKNTASFSMCSMGEELPIFSGLLAINRRYTH